MTGALRKFWRVYSLVAVFFVAPLIVLPAAWVDHWVPITGLYLLAAKGWLHLCREQLEGRK